MRNRILRILIPTLAVAVLLLAALLHSGMAASSGTAKATDTPKLTALQKRLLSGFANNALELQSSGSSSAKPRNYFPDSGDDQCALTRGSNIKVNQNCLNLTDIDLQGRGQANNETTIAVNPNNPNDFVAGDNDYRRGDSNCYGAYTLDGAQQWNDTTVPMGFTRGTAFGGVLREYWEAGGDPSVAWDTRGNAYFSCLVFQRGPGVTNNPDQSSGIYVFRSTHNNGASWNFPARPVAEQFTTGTSSGLPLLDKPYISVDDHVGSPFRDRIYVTYTLFAADGTAYIYESFSKDYGETFSPRVLVSKNSPLCANTLGVPTPHGSCNNNQFSQPFTGPDGALYVVYDNFNSAVTKANNNHFQVLLSKSTDGGKTFSAPVLVAYYNDLPDCATYQAGQDLGNSCVPEKGSSKNSVFRATNYPVGAVNPTDGKQVVVTFGSYINKDSNRSNGCVPTGRTAFLTPTYTGVKTAGACNNKILESISTNAGESFNGDITEPAELTVVSSAPGQAKTDQWWQWSAFTNAGKLAVSYYDRQYDTDEFNGHMDVSLSGSTSAIKSFAVVRVTSSSMPLPTEFADSLGNSLFFGDYSGLAVAKNTAYPIWMDTRDKDLALCPGTGAPGVPPQVCKFSEPNGLLANDQDIFMPPRR